MFFLWKISYKTLFSIFVRHLKAIRISDEQMTNSSCRHSLFII
uniref:Uncharacterized protein n=1 Tax=Microplitis mediator bracovirus TaxID=1836595 RepID=A0A2I6SGV8_9VIRU|nr:hypothetical protein MmBV_CMP11 [Microplitis mediator bracovirus]